LNGHILAFLDVYRLVYAPGDANVIEDNAAAARELNGVAARARERAGPDPYEPDDDVVYAIGILGKELASDSDAGAGSGLAGDGDVRLGDRDVAVDDATDIEDDDARAGRRDGSLQRAGAGGVEIGECMTCPPRPPVATAP
jgi:hypothetical protein